MEPTDPTLDDLVRRLKAGDEQAREQLLRRSQPLLKRAIIKGLDARISSRVDPSDIVQDTLADAARRLDDYVVKRPVPFFAWIRQIAFERMIDAHRQHLQSKRRTVKREEARSRPDEHSAPTLGELPAKGRSVSSLLMNQERLQSLMLTIEKLRPADREIVILRYIENLPSARVAAKLGISEVAARARVLRAVTRLRSLLRAAKAHEVGPSPGLRNRLNPASAREPARRVRL